MTGTNSAVTGKFSDPPVIMTGITSTFISRPAYKLHVYMFCKVLLLNIMHFVLYGIVCFIFFCSLIGPRQELCDMIDVDPALSYTSVLYLLIEFSILKMTCVICLKLQFLVPLLPRVCFL
jgi:hypothetical protein